MGILFILGSYLILSISIWRLLKKVGLPSWLGFMPVGNLYMLAYMARAIWIIPFGLIGGIVVLILLLFPFSQDSIFVLSLFPFLAAHIIFCIKLAKSFKKDIFFAFGLMILPPVYLMILAFGERGSSSSFAEKFDPIHIVVVLLFSIPLSTYVCTFFAISANGSYKLSSSQSGINWVWREPLLWNEPIDDGNPLSRSQTEPTGLGLMIMPMIILEQGILGTHQTLPAARDKGDGVCYEYPDLGLSFGYENSKCVKIPGRTSSVAYKNYEMR